MRDIILGILIFTMGFLIGYLVNDDVGMKETSVEIISEIKSLQKDITRVEIQATENFIKIDYLEHWRDSVVFRPPPRKPKP